MANPKLHVRCPSCDHEGSVPASMAGKRLQCPQCKQKFSVPSGGFMSADEEEFGSAPGRGTNWLKVVGLYICLPLFVTIVGGLAVEWLKPREGAPVRSVAGNVEQVVSSSQPPPATPKTSPVQENLLGQWTANEQPTIYGERSVQFLTGNQLIRTYKRAHSFDDVNFNYSYQVDEKGNFSADPQAQLKLVSVTPGELVLSWEGGIVRYKRPWLWWHFALMGLGVLVLAGIGAAIKEKKGG